MQGMGVGTPCDTAARCLSVQAGISDSRTQPMRLGCVGIALGCAGVLPVEDTRGTKTCSEKSLL
ncbi:F420-0:Gamma-glutamyl ligase (F420 biosynthesis) [Candidatus Methanomarinus sp.]|nr:F420-0:Gamma-glutamyl ligase (F420 biosynthesis) [ANME-2 cluster archaeon]